MTTHTLNVVLKSLATLPSEELKIVAAQTKAHLGLEAASPLPKPTDDNDYLLTGIRYELRRRGLIGPDQQVPPASFPKGYTATSYSVRQNLESHVRPLKGPEQTALGRFAVRCLAEWMELRNIHVSPKSMLLNIGNVPTAIDYAYPGYIPSGLLSFCLKLRDR